MALFGFLQEPLHLSLPKYRSRQQMPVKLRRNNARRRARFVASSDSLLVTCDVNVFLQAARNVGHHLFNDLKRPHAMMESVLNMPERKDQGSLATSRTTSLIIRPSASATGSQKEATSPRSNGPRRFGPEVSIRRHAWRERQTLACRALLPAYPSTEISIQRGEKSERFYKEDFRKVFGDKLPSESLSSIGALCESG